MYVHVTSLSLSLSPSLPLPSVFVCLLLLFLNDAYEFMSDARSTAACTLSHGKFDIDKELVARHGGKVVKNDYYVTQ